MTRLLWLLMLAGTPLVYEVLLYITNKSIRYSNLGKLDLPFLEWQTGLQGTQIASKELLKKSNW